MLKKFIFLILFIIPISLLAQKKGADKIILDNTNTKITDITELLYFNKYEYTVEGNVVTTQPKALPKYLGIYCVKFTVQNGHVQCSSFFIPKNAVKDPNAPWGIGKCIGKVDHIYKSTFMFGMTLMDILHKNGGGQLSYQ
ncbi:MAG: hypothetical protein E6Q95_06295 [Chitinophagaceae bacterium]|nr:MAG: hypothetical protein E6Q95_06295 [Chitinophagaceae bacterium]